MSDETVELALVGDVYVQRPNPESTFAYAGKFLRAADIAFGNLETVVADGREAFLARDRFPNADRLILGWPEAAFAELGIDRATYICLLSHDPKFDEPALRLALRSSAQTRRRISRRRGAPSASIGVISSF